MCNIYNLQSPSMVLKDKPFLSSERMIHKDYDCKGPLKKFSGRDPQEAWREDELIGSKWPVVKCPWLWLTEVIYKELHFFV
jgi:hypothetical protein